MLVTPNIHLNGECAQAIQLYEKALGAQTQVFLRYSDFHLQDENLIDQAHKDYVYHAEIWIGEQRIMLSDTMKPLAPVGNTVSLVVTFDDAGSVKKAYGDLSDGCTIVYPMVGTPYSSCFVSLIDRFGVRWELMTEQTER